MKRTRMTVMIPIIVPMMHFSRLVKAGSVTPMTQLHLGHLCVNFLNPLRQQARHPTIQEKKQKRRKETKKHQIHPKSLIESSTTVVTFMLHVLQWVVAGVTPRSARWRWTTTMV